MQRFTIYRADSSGNPKNTVYPISADINDIRIKKCKRMQIEQLITEFAPTMLLVEHDNVFCSAHFAGYRASFAGIPRPLAIK